MHHTRHLTLVFRLYGNTVSVIPHGDHCILQITAAGAIYHRQQMAVDPFSCHSNVSPDMLEIYAGIIRNLFL